MGLPPEIGGYPEQVSQLLDGSLIQGDNRTEVGSDGASGCLAMIVPRFHYG